MHFTERVISIVRAAPWRRQVIESVAALGLPDCYIAGGFIRNAVWDALYAKADASPINDVDVVYYRSLGSYGMLEEELIVRLAADESNPIWQEETSAETALKRQFPDLIFEVKNQARMHLSDARTHTHAPYLSIKEALADWPETATPIGVRISATGTFEVIAPRGLDDLFAGVLRATRPDYEARLRERAAKKGWLERWPQLRIESYKRN